MSAVHVSKILKTTGFLNSQRFFFWGGDDNNIPKVSVLLPPNWSLF